MDIVAVIVEFVAAGCGCDFTVDRLTDRVFLCPPSSPQSVTYQVQLHGTLQAPVTDLITLMEVWASSGVTIPVQLLPLIVDSGCASLTSSTVECEVTEPTQTEGTTREILSIPSNAGQVVVIVVVALVVVVVVAVVISILVAIFITTRMRKAKLQPKNGTG